MRATDHDLKTIIGETQALLQEIADEEGNHGARKEEIDYYNPSKLRAAFNTMNDLHLRLCDSIRNTSWMRRVITDERFHEISGALVDYSLDSVCKGGFALVTNIIAKNHQISLDELGMKRSWPTFIQGVVDGACYLGQFKKPDQFYDYVDGYRNTSEEAWGLAKDLDKRIAGIGPALACDFLKEIGVDRFSKPDTQIIKSFRMLKLIDRRDKQKEAFDVIWRMADLTDLSPAVIDKIVWIAASGRWDKTLDKTLASGATRKRQAKRKERFRNLLNRLQG